MRHRSRCLFTTVPLGGSPVRATRDLLRKSTEKLFLPFLSQRQSTADLADFRFRENLANVFVPSLIDNSPQSSAKAAAATSSSGNSTTATTSSNGSSNGKAAATVSKSQPATAKPRAARNGGNFLCAMQLNGEVGNSRLLEDFFHILLSGFDIVHVNVENRDGCSMASALQDPCHFRGFFILAHSRPFLGWQPTFLEMPRDVFTRELSPNHGSCAVEDRASSAYRIHASDIGPFAVDAAEEGVVRLPMTFRVPFSTHVEGHFTSGHSGFLLSHMNLRARFAEALSANPDDRETFGVDGNRLANPPDAVMEALHNKHTMQLVAGLRRLGVPPELITAETLLQASKEHAARTKGGAVKIM